MQRDGSCRYSRHAALMIMRILVDIGASTAHSVESLANMKWVALQQRGMAVTTALVREAYREHTGEDWRD